MEQNRLKKRAKIVQELGLFDIQLSAAPLIGI
jgi:hypothetical protein